MGVRVNNISGAPHLLGDVIRLADQNRQTLGFFPEAAFEKAAQDDLILVAVDDEDNLLGYLLYRIVKTKHRAAITHLCVKTEHRRRGIARHLVSYLKDQTKYLRGISLFSRIDYESHALWPRLGFRCIDEKPGRGKDQIPLSHFWFEHGEPPLLKLMQEAEADSVQLRAVIDHNIFISLFEKSSHPLAVDWLLADVAFYVTPEHYNEITRDRDVARRHAMRRYAQTLAQMNGDHDRIEQIEKYIRPFFPDQMTEQDYSDRRHLAYAIEFEADFFVTNDHNLKRDLGDVVHREYSLRIVTDTDLIIHLDELMQEAKYQPRRWAGTFIRRAHVSTGESNALAELFHRHSGESKAEFRDKLNYYLAHPHDFETYVIRTEVSDPLAMVVLSIGRQRLREVPLLRSIEGPLSPAFESSLASWLLAQDVLEHSRLVRITDEYLSDEMVTGLKENSFATTATGWVKLNIPGVYSRPKIGEIINDFKADYDLDQTLLEMLLRQLAQTKADDNLDQQISLEKRLWPLKLVDVDVPTYIVPIWPQWAAELFDDRLSRQTLFGADPSLMLKMDNVYYRAARPRTPAAPSRILWYVSRGGNSSYSGTMAVRACAYVAETVTGPPKEVFGRFSDLGVFRWQQVFEAANESVTEDVLAFRFGRSELFENPVRLQEINQITGRRSAPQAPWPLTNDAFLEIYMRGRKLK